MTKGAAAWLVAASLGLASAGCTDSQGNADPGKTALAVVTAPLWLPLLPAVGPILSKGPPLPEPPRDYKPSKAEKEHIEAVSRAATEQLNAAAENNDPQAQFELGMRYESSGDFAGAAAWYRKSADRGWGNSQFRVGVIHQRELGVQLDNVQADIWYCIAANSKESSGTAAIDAAIYRDDIEKKMTPEQFAEARKRAQEWMPSSSGTTVSRKAAP